MVTTNGITMLAFFLLLSLGHWWYSRFSRCSWWSWPSCKWNLCSQMMVRNAAIDSRSYLNITIAVDDEQGSAQNLSYCSYILSPSFELVLYSNNKVATTLCFEFVAHKFHDFVILRKKTQFVVISTCMSIFVILAVRVWMVVLECKVHQVPVVHK